MVEKKQKQKGKKRKKRKKYGKTSRLIGRGIIIKPNHDVTIFFFSVPFFFSNF